MLNFEQVSIQINKSDNYKISGYVGVFCPHCYQPIIININYSYNIKSYDSSIVQGPNLNGFKLPIAISCPKCHYNHTYTYWMDPNITPLIALLNCKGYITTACCEGHNFDDPTKYMDDNHCKPRKYEYGFIAFKDYQLNEVQLPPLPYPWEVAKNVYHYHNKDKYHDNPIREKEFAIVCNDKNVLLEDKLNALKEWIIQLPFNPFYNK